MTRRRERWAGDEETAIAPVVCVQNAYALGYRPQTDAFIRSLNEQGIAAGALRLTDDGLAVLESVHNSSTN